MFFSKRVIEATLRRSSNSREVRHIIDETDFAFSDRDLFLQALQARRLRTDRIVYVDVGARGGPLAIMGPFKEILYYVICEADKEEAKNLLSHFPKDQVFLIEQALSDQFSKRILYLTKSAGTSSLLKPRGNALALRGGDNRDLDRFEVVRQIEVETAPLYLCVPNNVENLDVLKIDVQGMEFEVLSGLGTFRPFLICAECSSAELYVDQKSVFAVGSLLEKHGYMAIKLMESQLVPKTSAKFQNSIQVHGDVIFVPDNSANGQAIIRRDVEKWFAVLCMHGYMDFALWQIEELKIPKPDLILQTEEILLKN